MRWLAFVLLSFLVATCGQKGPLSLPEEEALHSAPAPGEPLIRAAARVIGEARGDEVTPARYGVARESSRSEWQA